MIELQPTPWISDIADSLDVLQAATLSLPGVEEDISQGEMETLPLPSCAGDMLDASIVGTIKPLSKLAGGTHILDTMTQTWKWTRRGESSIIREGDRLALLLHPIPGSALPDCLRDEIPVKEARCLLGIDFLGPAAPGSSS